MEFYINVMKSKNMGGFNKESEARDRRLRREAAREVWNIPKAG